MGRSTRLLCKSWAERNTGAQEGPGKILEGREHRTRQTAPHVPPQVPPLEDGALQEQ